MLPPTPHTLYQPRNPVIVCLGSSELADFPGETETTTGPGETGHLSCLPPGWKAHPLKNALLQEIWRFGHCVFELGEGKHVVIVQI